MHKHFILNKDSLSGYQENAIITYYITILHYITIILHINSFVHVVLNFYIEYDNISNLLIECIVE